MSDPHDELLRNLARIEREIAEAKERMATNIIGSEEYERAIYRLAYLDGAKGAIDDELKAE